MTFQPTRGTRVESEESAGFMPKSGVQMNAAPSPRPERQGILSRFIGDTKSSFERRRENIDKMATDVYDPDVDVSEGAARFGTIGQIFGGMSDVFGSGVEAAARGVYQLSARARSLVTSETYEQIRDKDGAAAKAMGSLISNQVIPTKDGETVGEFAIRTIEEGGRQWAKYEEENPEDAMYIVGLANTADFISNFVGARVGKTAIKGGLEATEQLTEQGLKQGARALGAAQDVAKPAIGAVQDAAKPAIAAGLRTGERVAETGAKFGGAAKEVALSGAETVKQIPSNILTNTAASRVEREAIEALPDIVRPAVKSGVLERDALLLANTVSEAEKGIQDKMKDAAIQFAKNRSGVDPADVAGNVLTKRMKDAQNIVDDIGGRLGAIANDLPIERTKGVRDEIMQRLRKVPGLENLTMTPNGALDFSGTTLSSAFTAADRKAIQTAWDSTKERGARELHNLRQELFDVIKGEKRGLTVKSAVRDDGINAIRMGISDSLDSVSEGYKLLNQEYAQAINPLERLKKFYKGTEGAVDNILDERAGSLMRRLTSNATSRSELKQILSELDALLTGAGTLTDDISLERLQDFYNALSRYYDITKDTSLAGQSALASSSIPVTKVGMATKALDTVLKTGQQTPEVTRKAFEDLFDLVRSSE